MKRQMHLHARRRESANNVFKTISRFNRSYTFRSCPQVTDTLRTLIIFLCSIAVSFFAQCSFAATTPGATPGSFSVNESGAASYSIPIAIPPGTAGIQPTLSLQYNSQSGNGLLGMGWSLGGLSAITRCPQTQALDGVRGSVNYDANDRLCLDGQRLIVVSGAYGTDGAEYRTEQESFSRVISYGVAGSGPASFKVWTKSGQVMEYGVTSDARIEAQGKSSVAVWALNKVQDTVGNYFSISYTKDNPNGQYYPARIDYTGNASSGLTPYNSVQFVYETRPDITPMYHAGSLMKATVRLKNIQSYANAALVKEYRLVYDVSIATNQSRLTSLTECTGDGVCLIKTALGWSLGGANGTWSISNNGTPWVNEPNTQVITGDFNGDGKTDFLLKNPGYGSTPVFLSNGDGTWSISNNGTPWVNEPNTQVITGDFNGDGKTDFLLKNPGYGSTPVFLSNGDGTWSISNNGTPWVNEPNTQVITGDFNGDGKTDFLLKNPGYGSTPVFLSASSNNLLTSITTGLDITTTITYKPLTDNSAYTKNTTSTYPTVDIQAPIYVVSSTSTSDGVGGNYQMTYRYSGMKARQDGRGTLGFRTVTTTNPQTGIVSRTEYRQDYPYIGMPTLVTNTTASGLELSRIENSYAEKIIAGAGKFPYLAYSKTQSQDLNGTALPFAETWNETFDDYGNSTKVTVKTSDGFSTWSDNVYTNDAKNWLLGRLTRATVSKSINGGAAQIRTSAFTYNASTGLLNQEVVEPDQPAMRVITDYVYDAYGNKTQATVSGGDTTAGTSFAARSTSTTYDSKGRFPISSTNALGHTETRVYDERFGLVRSLTGPNLLTTTWAYDGFGRKTQEVRADATQTTWAYADCVSACGFARYSITVTSSGAPPAVTYYDMLNRAVHTAGTGFDGQTIYADTEYDAQARVKRSSRPYFANAGTIYWTTPTYDTIGRTTRVDEPDGSFSRTDYNGLTTVGTNPQGQTKTELKNSQGQTVTVTDAANGVTGFVYDPFGNLIETRPAGGGLLVNRFDLRGRKISMTDPVMGYWTYAYNALGELIQQTDAKKQVSSLTYDLLGRLKTRVEPGMSSSWTYDSAANGKGKLASVTGGGVTKTYTYDTLGRPTRLATLVDGKTFNQDNSYDSLGRVLIQTRPSGFATRNLYNAYGYQTELDNARTDAPLWRAVAVDAEGRITQNQYGNGVVNTRTYQPQNGRLTSIQANAPGTTSGPGALLQNQSYSYDSLGNPLTRVDTLTSGGRNETFQYDTLNRLTQTSLTQGGVVQTPVSLTYNAMGNITSKSDVGPYTYDATKIHAVIAAGSNKYDYDSNGNLIGGAGRAVNWTAWNMPDSDTYGGATTSWSYDADHVRIKQVTGAKTTYYLNPRVDLGGHYEEEYYTGGRIDQINSLYASGQFIGQITTTNQVNVATKTRYFHSDHLGSISLVTNESGAVASRYTYDAWGKRQMVVGSEELHHGFTGHEHLDEGFIHMNGRLYDPVLARFISADPTIQDASDGQSFNRYSYVGNNPLSYTDPSGYSKFGKFFKAGLRFGVNPSAKNAFKYLAAHPGQDKVDRYVLTHQWAYSVGLIATTAATVICGGCGGVAYSSYYAYQATGSMNAAFKAGAITYVSSELFYGAGEIGSAVTSTYGVVAGYAASLAAHAAAGCISAEMGGGSCGSGALSAGVSKLGTIAFGGYGGGVGGIIASAVIGGTASAIGGGKFENGAITGAFGYLFNCVAHKCYADDYAGKSPGHTYGPFASDVACNVSTAGCLAAAQMELGCNSAPGQSACTPVGAEKSYSLAGVSSSNPITQYRPNADLIINGTSPGHVLHDGYVVRWLDVNAAGNVRIWTYGLGVNTGYGTAIFNDVSGSVIFRNKGAENVSNIRNRLGQ